MHAVHQLVDAQAARTRLAVAVECENRAMTYGDLSAASSRLAHQLRRLGVGRDVVVSVCLERSPELVIAILAILKAGGAYLPLDPDQPASRLRGMVADAGSRLVLTQGTLRVQASTLLDPVGGTVLAVDDDAAAWAQESETPPAEFSADDSLAYVIYTSGSTGEPKGVEITHGGLRNHIVWAAEQLRASPGDAVLQRMAISFDAAVTELFVPLITGGRLVLARPGGHRDPDYLIEAIARHGVTILQSVPSALRTLVRRPDIARCRTLRYIVSGGELLDHAVAREVLDALPQVVLANFYGPTEASNVATFHELRAPLDGEGPVPIGRAAANVRCYVLDDALRPVPEGTPGELCIGGAGVGRGYRGRPGLTAERFIADPFTPGGRLFRTGDRVRTQEDGALLFLGRMDLQLKIRGHRVEPAEIEQAIARFPGVTDQVVVSVPAGEDETRLAAYVVGGSVDVAALRRALGEALAAYLVPSSIVVLEALPRLPNGKIDRARLPTPAATRPALSVPFAQAQSDDERRFCAAFARVLSLEGVGRDDNFFELGGSSLSAIRVLDEIAARGGPRISVPTIFAHPTPRSLAESLRRPAASPAPVDARRADATAPIAIIGMSGRFPGASSVEALWQLLVDGRDGTTEFSDDALDPSVPAEERDRSDYVRARGILPEAQEFDAAFFGIPRREAEVTDPQHRLLLELAWECLERAGHAPDAVTDAVGVFAGVGPPTYLTRNVLARPELVEAVGNTLVTIGNDKDYAAMRVANRLDLRGPAVAVNTACSTSLVAVALAVESLRAGRCRMALAGGAHVHAPIAAGYVYQEGAMLSPDARTRTFDSDARGTSFNDGAAMVLLKRLDDALADGDTIHGVIRGVGLNNDGGAKASFTAPSVEGQEAVIVAALADAGVSPADISYVEAHGTATPLGDPVEVEALTKAFRRGSDATGSCRIGSVKSNVGHLVSAAGATGLIKTVLALTHEQLPATLHYRSPNPLIPFDSSPFVVLDRPSAWTRGAHPRFAGVSSFGVGGTNAHVVVQEAPLAPVPPAATGVQLLQLSARTSTALDAMQRQLADHLVAASDIDLADVAFTLREGRSQFAHRAVIAAESVSDAVAALRDRNDPWRSTRVLPAQRPAVALLFPGQGAQYVGMGSELYAREPVFRAAFDACCDALGAMEGAALRDGVFRGSAEDLKQTSLSQPATFCLEYALAQWWLARGLRPEALIGHSVGEFVSAAVAGVMSPQDAVRLVAQRGQLMQAVARGSMLSVRARADDMVSRLPAELSLAAENGPLACVVSGEMAAIERFAAALDADGISTRPLATSHAFHSAMMDGVVPQLRSALEGVALHPPRIPIVSTVSGEWLRADQATDPDYWARHLRVPVRFSPAVRTVLARGDVLFVEAGPRGTLSTLARQHVTAAGTSPIAVASLGDSPAGESRLLHLAAGALWTAGVTLTPADPVRRRRVVLPTYPFERVRTWIDAPAADGASPRAMRAVAVPPAAMDAPSTAGSADAAPDAMHARVSALFEEIAGVELLGRDPDTPFVELGLDSLTLTQVAQRLKKVFSVDVTFRELMTTHRSLASLSAHIAAPSVRYDVKTAFGAIARIHRDPNALTERQQARLDAFIRRYVERTRRSKEYTARHRDVLADPRVVNGFRPQTKEIVYQLVIERSRGSRMWDLDGNEYVDALGGFGMCLFGWQPDFVQEAVRRQLDEGYEIGPLHPLAAEVAGLVCALTGCDRAALVNTGSEAVMGAIRIARTSTARPKIVTFSGSYHGTFDEVLVRAGKDHRGMPAVPGVMPTMFGDVIVLEYGSPEALEVIRAQAADIAAVLVEPVQSRRPDFQPREFLQALRALTEQRGICLIFDEVITGFRSQLGGAQEFFGVRADVVTYGKVIGGGMPIGVIAGVRQYMDALDGGSWTYGDASAPSVGVTYLAGTFVRHPLALAAAKASLEYLRDAGPQLQEGLNARIDAMVARMNAHARKRGAPVEVRHFSSLWKLFFTEDHPWQDLIFAMMRSRGIHILDNFPCYGTTALSDADIDAIASAFEASVDEMQESGFLPARVVDASRSMDPDAPPVEGARLGRDAEGRPAWFVPHPEQDGRYVMLDG